MATVALNDDQKEFLRTSLKFAPMIRSAVLRKAKFWAVTTDPTAVPGGQTALNIIRWAKSRILSSGVQANINQADSEDYKTLFLKNLTQAVWDNVAVPAPLDTTAKADAIILNMEANVASMIDAPMDTTFDDKILYMVF